jgi:hypothetical protein
VPSSSSEVGKERHAVIEGLRLEMKTEELVALLNERIAWHEHKARDCDRQLAAGDADDASPGENRSAAHRFVCADDKEEEACALPVLYPPRHVVRMERDDHLEQAAFLILLRDHLVPGEVYRLAEEDLRLADVVPSGLFPS